MGRRLVAQAALADKRQIAVVGVRAGRVLRAEDGLAVRRNVDVEIFEPEEVGARIVGNRRHPIHADAGDVLQTAGTRARAPHFPVALRDHFIDYR